MIVVLSSLVIKFVLIVIWLLLQWLAYFPHGFGVHAYLKCIQVCSGFPSTTQMFQSYGIKTLHDSTME